MLLVIGECRGVTSENVEWNNQRWIEETLHVEIVGGDSVRTEAIRVGKDFRGSKPDKGDLVALEVSVRAFTRKGGGAGYGFTAWSRASEVEDLVKAKNAKGVRPVAATG